MASSLIRQAIKKERLGFLAQMEQTGEPLLLLKGGYWRLESLRDWSTDIEVVEDAQKDDLLKRVTVHREDCLDARELTARGHTFAKKFLRKIETDGLSQTQYRKQKKLRETTAKTIGPRVVVLADGAGLWLARDQHMRLGLTSITSGGGLVFKCNFCSKVWPPTAGGGDQYFRCPNGCNSALTIDYLVTRTRAG